MWWPFRKFFELELEDGICFKAMAYLKQALRDDGSSQSFEIPDEECPVLKKLNDELLIAYIVDQRHSFQYVARRHLQADAINEDDLHRIGLANLQAYCAAKNLRVFPDPQGRVFGVLLDGNLEASLMLIDELWNDSFRQFVAGEYLIAIPNRDILCFCDRASEIGRAELKAVVQRVKDSSDHTLTQTMYARIRDEWVPDD